MQSKDVALGVEMVVVQSVGVGAVDPGTLCGSVDRLAAARQLAELIQAADVPCHRAFKNRTS